MAEAVLRRLDAHFAAALCGLWDHGPFERETARTRLCLSCEYVCVWF